MINENNKPTLGAIDEKWTRNLQLQYELLLHLNHFLLTPINTITATAKKLEEGMYGSFNTEQISWLNRIYRAAHHLQTMLHEISDIVKITKDNKKPLPLPAKEIANTCLGLINESATKKNIKTSVILDPAVTVIHTDKEYLKTILFHLLKEAVNSTPTEGEISLEIRGNAEKCVVELMVLNTKRSMSENDINRFLFNRLEDFSLFFQLTERYGGNISVESLDKEVCFTVSLPWQSHVNKPPVHENRQLMLTYYQAKLEYKKRRLNEFMSSLKKEDIVSTILTEQQKRDELKKQMASLIEKEDKIPGYLYLHELRTPLCAITGPVLMLQEEEDGPVNVQQSKPLSTIYENAHYFLSVINDLSNLIKLKQGKLELGSKKSLSISKEELGLNYIEEFAQKKHLKMMTTFDPAVTTIQAYGDGYYYYYFQGMILQRLLNNAIRFTEPGGTIALNIRGDAKLGMAHFMISDTGKGMAEEEVKCLFNKEPFVQLDGYLDEINEDLNLGLSLVYRFVKLHGGSISVESQVGKGSRFTVSLPWQPVTITSTTKSGF